MKKQLKVSLTIKYFFLEEEEFIVKTSIGENRVFVSMKAIGDFEAEFLEPF